MSGFGGSVADDHGAIERSLGSQGTDRDRHVGEGDRAIPDCSDAQLSLVVPGQCTFGNRNRAGLSGTRCLRLRRLAPVLASTRIERLSLLARSRLCHRGALGRHHGRCFRHLLAIAIVGVLTFISGAVVAGVMAEGPPTNLKADY